jgi:hypothetical protein
MSEQLQFAQFSMDDPLVVLERLINQVLWGKNTTHLPDKARELLGILQYHKGVEHARPLSDIASRLKVNEREVKQLAKTLTEEFQIPVGASRQQPYGYYLCTTDAERRGAAQPYIREIISLARRVRALQPEATMLELEGQGRLIFDEEKTA